MDINQFVNLTGRAWSTSILAQMHAGVAARQAPLLHATGASRTAFAQSMDHLVLMGLIERNPGYGHPLRPEFRLTKRGATVAQMAHNIHSAAPETAQVLLRRAWTLPVLLTVREPRFFNQIKLYLPPVTDRALSQSLKLLEAQDWISRQIVDGRPPRPIYHAANYGHRIAGAVAQAVDIG